MKLEIWVIVSQVPNLSFSLVFSLDEFIDYGGSIPSDEVWFKQDGDKGGDTFKLMVQVANVEYPNGMRNTQVIALFPASDSPYNLDLALRD